VSGPEMDQHVGWSNQEGLSHFSLERAMKTSNLALGIMFTIIDERNYQQGRNYFRYGLYVDCLKEKGLLSQRFVI
jgi:hypothetical protein